MTDTNLYKAFDLDRRLQNFEKVLRRLIDRIPSLGEELRAEWHRLLDAPTEPTPAQPATAPVPETAPAVVDPTNPPKSSTEDSETPEPKIVAPDISNSGMSDGEPAPLPPVSE